MDLAARISAGLDEAAHLVGSTLVKHVKDQILSGEKSGRHYPGLPNQSSAPGEYSANQSGDLLNSIDYRVEDVGLVDFFATSGHAGYQEYGTSKMGARPNLWMAIEECDSEIKQILTDVVSTALGGGT